MSEYIVDFGTDDKSFVRIAMAKQHGAELRRVIVRCGDCKYCMAYMAGAYCDYMAHAIESDGYCAWGERKVSE